jgi:Skp family chaperone for outer membrane proteins
MKKLFTSVFIISSLLSFNSFANSVATLDVEKIVKESLAMRDIQKKISDKQTSYQKEVDKKNKSVEAEQKKLESKKNVLSEEAMEKELKQLEEKVNDLKSFVDKRQNSLKKASIDSMSKVNEEIKIIIEEISKEQNIDLIIPTSQTLYFKDEMDISSEVLKRLNKKITKVAVKFEI